MGRKLILCFDGTWNRPDDDAKPDDIQVETNPRRLFEATLDGPAVPDQIKWYDEGVGNGPCWFDKIGGGAFGLGLDVKIMDGYRYLALTYEQGDRVYVFGYSRGAYSARSLMGLIRKCGLVHREYVGFTKQAYELYRTRHGSCDCDEALTFRKRFSREIKVHFMGLFDSVGSLGVPISSFSYFNQSRYEFHDVMLSSNIENAYHALALDEHRDVFNATLFNPASPLDQHLEQRWFVGSHADVGGGELDRRLSDLTLRWMMERALAHGLIFHPHHVPLRVERNHLANVTDSYASFLEGGYSVFNDPYFRPVGQTLYGNEVLDESVLQKIEEDPLYQPVNPGVFVG